MINTWRILHQAQRLERVPFSVSHAERLGVPLEQIKFWYGKNPNDYQNAPELIEAVSADGFPQLAVVNVRENRLGISGFCYTWNILRYLRHVASRTDTEVLIHDGTMLRSITNHPFHVPISFQWLSDMVSICREHAAPKSFKTFVCGDMATPFPIALIRPDSLIIKGMLVSGPSFRIYSPEGARRILDFHLSRMVEHESPYIYDAKFFYGPDSYEIEPFWLSPGMYTFLIQKTVMDTDRDYLGSDKQLVPPFQGVYAKLFERFTNAT